MDANERGNKKNFLTRLSRDWRSCCERKTASGSMFNSYFYWCSFTDLAYWLPSRLQMLLAYYDFLTRRRDWEANELRRGSQKRNIILTLLKIIEQKQNVCKANCSLDIHSNIELCYIFAMNTLVLYFDIRSDILTSIQ